MRFPDEQEVALLDLDADQIGEARAGCGCFREELQGLLRSKGKAYKVQELAEVKCWLVRVRFQGTELVLHVYQQLVDEQKHEDCEQCRCMGWSDIPTTRARFHFIIPPTIYPEYLPATLPNVVEHRRQGIEDSQACNPSITGASYESKFHLLHGLVHSNGYGHMMRLNGKEGGSRVFSGYQLMELWDKLCIKLNCKSISTEDASNKRRMELRVLHPIAYNKLTFYGNWNYVYGRGAYNISKKQWEEAVEWIANSSLQDIVSDLQQLRDGAQVVGIIQHYGKLGTQSSLTKLGELIKRMLGFLSKPEEAIDFVNIEQLRYQQWQWQLSQQNLNCSILAQQRKAITGGVGKQTAENHRKRKRRDIQKRYQAFKTESADMTESERKLCKILKRLDHKTHRYAVDSPGIHQDLPMPKTYKRPECANKFQDFDRILEQVLDIFKQLKGLGWVSRQAIFAWIDAYTDLTPQDKLVASKVMHNALTDVRVDGVVIFRSQARSNRGNVFCIQEDVGQTHPSQYQSIVQSKPKKQVPLKTQSGSSTEIQATTNLKERQKPVSLFKDPQQFRPHVPPPPVSGQLHKPSFPSQQSLRNQTAVNTNSERPNSPNVRPIKQPYSGGKQRNMLQSGRKNTSYSLLQKLGKQNFSQILQRQFSSPPWMSGYSYPWRTNSQPFRHDPEKITQMAKSYMQNTKRNGLYNYDYALSTFPDSWTSQQEYHRKFSNNCFNPGQVNSASENVSNCVRFKKQNGYFEGLQGQRQLGEKRSRQQVEADKQKELQRRDQHIEYFQQQVKQNDSQTNRLICNRDRQSKRRNVGGVPLPTLPLSPTQSAPLNFLEGITEHINNSNNSSFISSRKNNFVQGSIANNEQQQGTTTNFNLANTDLECFPEVREIKSAAEPPMKRKRSYQEGGEFILPQQLSTQEFLTIINDDRTQDVDVSELDNSRIRFYQPGGKKCRRKRVKIEVKSVAKVSCEVPKPIQDNVKKESQSNIQLAIEKKSKFPPHLAKRSKKQIGRVVKVEVKENKQVQLDKPKLDKLFIDNQSLQLKVQQSEAEFSGLHNPPIRNIQMNYVQNNQFEVPAIDKNCIGSEKGLGQKVAGKWLQNGYFFQFLEPLVLHENELEACNKQHEDGTVKVQLNSMHGGVQLDLSFDNSANESEECVQQTQELGTHNDRSSNGFLNQSQQSDVKNMNEEDAEKLENQFIVSEGAIDDENYSRTRLSGKDDSMNHNVSINQPVHKVQISDKGIEQLPTRKLPRNGKRSKQDKLLNQNQIGQDNLFIPQFQDITIPEYYRLEDQQNRNAVQNLSPQPDSNLHQHLGSSIEKNTTIYSSENCDKRQDGVNEDYVRVFFLVDSSHSEARLITLILRYEHTNEQYRYCQQQDSRRPRTPRSRFKGPQAWLKQVNQLLRQESDSFLPKILGKEQVDFCESQQLLQDQFSFDNRILIREKILTDLSLLYSSIFTIYRPCHGTSEKEHNIPLFAESIPDTKSLKLPQFEEYARILKDTKLFVKHCFDFEQVFQQQSQLSKVCVVAYLQLSHELFQESSPRTLTQKEQRNPPQEYFWVSSEQTWQQTIKDMQSLYQKLYIITKDAVIKEVRVKGKREALSFEVTVGECSQEGRVDVDVFMDDINYDLQFRFSGGWDVCRTQCVCGIIDDDGARMIQCDRCGTWMHTRCVGIGDEQEPPENFLCEHCSTLPIQSEHVENNVNSKEKHQTETSYAGDEIHNRMEVDVMQQVQKQCTQQDMQEDSTPKLFRESS